MDVLKERLCVMDEHTTSKLDELLNRTDNVDKLQNYVDCLECSPIAESCQEYYISLSKVNVIGKAELIRRTNMDSSYGYQLLKGTRSPGRDKIILLCLAAGLDLVETQRALQSAKE